LNHKLLAVGDIKHLLVSVLWLQLELQQQRAQLKEEQQKAQLKEEANMEKVKHLENQNENQQAKIKTLENAASSDQQGAGQETSMLKKQRVQDQEKIQQLETQIQTLEKASISQEQGQKNIIEFQEQCVALESENERLLAQIQLLEKAHAVYRAKVQALELDNKREVSKTAALEEALREAHLNDSASTVCFAACIYPGVYFVEFTRPVCSPFGAFRKTYHHHHHHQETCHHHHRHNRVNFKTNYRSWKPTLRHISRKSSCWKRHTLTAKNRSRNLSWTTNGNSRK
jgi:hypothetical protein